jgi:hypothetical protein
MLQRPLALLDGAYAAALRPLEQPVDARLVETEQAHPQHPEVGTLHRDTVLHRRDHLEAGV